MSVSRILFPRVFRIFAKIKSIDPDLRPIQPGQTRLSNG